MKTRYVLLVGLIAFFGLIAIFRLWDRSTGKVERVHSGITMGVIQYEVKFLADPTVSYQAEIDSILRAFNQSLSTYIPDSEITQLNMTGRLLKPSMSFKEIMASSLVAWELTGGAFDPTIGPVVNLWGFGPKKEIRAVDSSEVDALLPAVGFDKVRFSNGFEMDTAMFLDFSAIAKGYAIDLVARFLTKKGVTNFMVEIGGEVRVSGRNSMGELWRIGIEDPFVKKEQQKLLAILSTENRSMATSGNYRNYYVREEDGVTIAHTIDPRTGFNTAHNLLSATVVTEECMMADAYATACMVLGVEGSLDLARKVGFDVFLVSTDTNANVVYNMTNGLSSELNIVGQ